jgi:NADH-quinone oxidoreductase subunit C
MSEKPGPGADPEPAAPVSESEEKGSELAAPANSESEEEGSEPAAAIHAESDEKAPIKGGLAEGESQPDAGTKTETLAASAPDVGSAVEEAVADRAAVVVAEPTAEVIAVRKGMFGAKGSGDTSGYGGLRRIVEFPAPSRPPFGGWWDQVYERIRHLMGEGGEGGGGPNALVPNYSEVITKVVIHRGEITFHVAREHLLTLVRFLRDDAQLRFEFCSSVSGVHYPDDVGRELHAVYHLQSMTHNRRIRLEVSAPDSDPHIPSVVATYPTADWHERETWDMFGIVFDGHPALTRILMPDDWPGHPQRKDYPLGGIPVEYKGATIPPPEQRRSYS